MTSRIELGSVPQRRVVCRDCKTEMIPGEEPTFFGQCRRCFQKVAKEQHRKFLADVRRTERRAATGKLKTVLPDDPFEGMKEGE